MSSSMPTKAFTTRSLISIRRALKPPSSPRPLPPHSVSSSRSPVEAAVLIPLMNIRDRPYVLMQVRAQKMRVHAGEVSFPGGKADDTDVDLIHTALREANEELALPSTNIEMLGMLEPEYSLGNKSRVWPFVGFVHPTPRPFLALQEETDDPLPSFPLETLRLSPAEVSALLPLPLDALMDPNRHSLHFFRLNTVRPYHRIRVSDLAIPFDSFPGDMPLSLSSEEANRGPIAEGIPDDLEAWGLSGWFLNKLAEKVGWLKPPPIPPLPED